MRARMRERKRLREVNKEDDEKSAESVKERV